MYEQSLRVPLMVRWSGVVTPGSINRQFVSILDLGPTLLNIAGSTAPEDWHGRSIVPLLRGKTPEDWPQAVYYHTYPYEDVPEHLGIRTHTHKLIRFPELGDYRELFDLRTDPDELNNRYREPKLAAQRHTLNSRFDQMVSRYDLGR